MTIIGIVLILLGCLIFVISMGPKNFDFSMLSSEKFEQKAYTTEKAFQSICIDEKYGTNINVLPSKDGICKIEYEESKNIPYDITIDADTLTIKQIDNRKWYHHINLGLYTPTLTVYLPKGAYNTLTVQANTSDIRVSDGFSFEGLKIHISTGDASVSADVSGELNIRASTGDITIQDSSAKTVILSVSTGDITVSNLTASGDLSANSSTGDQKFQGVTCGNASVTTSTGKQTYIGFNCAFANLVADTGDIRMTDLIASGDLKIETSTGDITFERCDAATMDIFTDTGDVTGSFRTPKIIYATSNTGKIEVPHSAEGGLCKIKTDTGKIKISYAE